MTKLTYVGRNVYRERRYIDRQPLVGDKIVVTSKVSSVRNYNQGNEGIITSVSTNFGDGVLVAMARSSESISAVFDGEYAIYEDIYRTLSHEEIEVKRFLGIPYRRKITKVWKEDVVHDENID